MATAKSFYRIQAEAINDALAELAAGSAVAFVGAQQVTSADQDTLLLDLEIHVLKACRLEVASGALKVNIVGREFNRPSLKDLDASIRELEQRKVQRGRGGIRVRLGVPC